MVFHPNYSVLFGVMPPYERRHIEARCARAAGFPLHLLRRIRKNVLDAYVLVYRLDAGRIDSMEFGAAIGRVLIGIDNRVRRHGFKVSLDVDVRRPPIALTNLATQQRFYPEPLV